MHPRKIPQDSTDGGQGAEPPKLSVTPFKLSLSIRQFGVSACSCTKPGFKMVMLMWIAVVLFSPTVPACAMNFSRPSFLSVKSGERVTLNCPFGAILASIFWYKQILGEMPQLVGKRLVYSDASIFPEFKTSGFKMETTNGDNISLIIPHIKKEDAGFYYCVKSFMDDFTLSSGTFVAVEDDGGVKVSVVQRGMWDSVPAGASVTLQCSVLSESRTAELQVIWFRAASSPSHSSQIIYSHANSSQQCESGSSTHSSVYNFSKNIVSLNDTGTYYCAVALCGKIVFGNGTRVQLETERSVDRVVICLAAALAVCVVVISALIFALTHRWRNCEGKFNPGSVTDKTLSKECDNEELNYAALHFNARRAKRGKVQKEPPKDVMYSEVRGLSLT